MKTKNKVIRVALPAFVAGLNILIVIYPAVALSAAQRGLSLWFNSVMPGILPFVIGANLLLALGAANFLGIFLSPVMKRLFKTSGRGGFALAMGLISGYPVGAKIVSEMRSKGELGKVEAQRLLGFTNNAGPLFILGAVAAGMFGSVALGYFLLAAHYIGALSVGLIMRIYGAKHDKRPQKENLQPIAVFSRPKESFGHILGGAVKNAMETMLIVGGFMMLFSVVSALLGQILPLNSQTHSAIFSGIIEMTNGIGSLSEQGTSRIIVAAVAALLSFGGLSILFQSLNFISKTDLNTPIYIL
ncbi:MAG: hypothetical protein FWE44_07020, partial [Defluviitaleaceae bacterium]|nr:hypothetical protein [Defluviitaleaceae bacterium]